MSGRDIRKIDIGNIVQVLKSWGDNCEAVIDMIDKQVQKVNTEREDRKAHEKKLEEKISKVDNYPGVIKCLLGERKSQAAASEWP